jgi:localization factor PodJL
MQPDLPWNVAGIPPEAREAARAAARREGLSVGEWLTRRILRSFTDSGTAPEAERAAWRTGVVEAARASIPPPPADTRETEEMLAHVSRSENEAQSAAKRIEEQLKLVARRLETAERNQSENTRAMSKAATEINIAAREQAQAFDQLGAHVVSLSDRLSRLESSGATESLKDAVKGLHQGLSRVADQIAQTANQSASQIASLAGNVESVAGKLAEARTETQDVSRTLEQHIATLDERIRVVERTAYSSATALDRTLENVERVRAAKEVGEAEVQRQSATLSQLSDALERLSSRISGSEAQTAGAMARLEENIAKVEARKDEGALDRRLRGIEHALSDLLGRLEHTERSSLGTAGTVEETLRDLATRIEAADKRNREVVSDLQATVKEATSRLAAVEKVAATPAPAVQQAAAAMPAQPIFDVPPFPETQPQPVAEPFEPPPFDPAFGMEPGYAGAPAFGADAFAASAAQQAAAAASESYLSAARRSARAAAAEAEQTARPSLGGFSWAFPGRSEAPAPERRSARYALVAAIAVVALVAAVAGMILSRGLSSPAPRAFVPPPATQQMAQPRPSLGQTDTTTVTEVPPTSQPEANTADDELASGSATTAPSGVSPRLTAPSTVKSSPRPANQTAGAPGTQSTPGTRPVGPSAVQSPIDKLTALANTGDSKGELLLGLKYLDGNGVAVNEAEAARWLARAAQQGEPVAQYRLGTLYERGRGVPADAKQATHWYELAARQGNRKAMHNLAVAFAEGSGEPKDYAQAAQWFAKAAGYGLADSQFNLAVLYERGMGVKQSLVDAYKWYAIAAAQGDTESKARIDALSTQLSPTDRAAAQQAAASFRPQPLNPAANTAPSLG